MNNGNSKPCSFRDCNKCRTFTFHFISFEEEKRILECEVCGTKSIIYIQKEGHGSILE